MSPGRQLAEAEPAAERRRPRHADGPPVYPATLFACQTFGRGRTFAMATDSTWAWGTEFETELGRRRQSLLPQVLAKRHLLAHRESRRIRPAGCGSRPTRSFTGRVEPIEVTARAYDEKLAETDRYRVVARFVSPERNRVDSRSSRTGTDLVAQLRDRTYRGKLMAPPREQDSRAAPARRSISSRSTSAPSTAIARRPVQCRLQVIDDPAEFRDPRPDPARLEQLARRRRDV